MTLKHHFRSSVSLTAVLGVTACLLQCGPPTPGNGAGDLGGTWRFTLTGDAASATDGTITVQDGKAHVAVNMKKDKPPFNMTGCQVLSVRMDFTVELSADGKAFSLNSPTTSFEQQTSESPPCSALVVYPNYLSMGGLQKVPLPTTHGVVGGTWTVGDAANPFQGLDCTLELTQAALTLDCPSRGYKAELMVDPLRIQGTDSDGVEISAVR